MTSTTGNRCAIYEKIDDLSEAQSVAALAAKLQPILNELAYYAINGEAAVMETREEWHTEFTDRLYSAMGSEHSAAVAARESKAPGAPRAPEAKTRHAAPGARAKGTGRGRGSHGGFDDSEERLPPPPPANRPKPDTLSPSLRAILEGTHPSFTEKDYEG